MNAPGEAVGSVPAIRVLEDSTLARVGEFYVESTATRDGRRFYRATVFTHSCAREGGYTTDAMGEWHTSATHACDDARAARAVFR